MRAMLGKKIASDRRWKYPAALVAVLALTFLAGSFGLDSRLEAEPYFAVREGYKCSKCHVNRTGGGMRTDYAKSYMETRMAMSSGTGAGPEAAPRSDFGLSRLSDAFSLGADLRQLVERRKFDGEQTNWHFGRRADCESCHTSTGGGGKVAELYERMEVMPGRASIVAGQSFVPGLTNRESFALLETETLNGYLKAGIFRMPSALRNTFDDPYLHGTVDFGAVPDVVGLEAVRANGMELGIEPGPFSVSVSVTNPGSLNNFKSAPPNGKRVHLNAYAAGRYGLLGLTAYTDPVRESLERRFTAIYGGTSLGRITGLAELDSVRERDPTSSVPEVQRLALLAQIDFLITRGQNIKWQYEAFDPDDKVRDNRSDRNSVIYEPFITPYLQFRGGVRRSEGPREKKGLNGTTIFMELHLMY